MFFIAFNKGGEFLWLAFAMMIAAIHEQVDAEMHGTLHGMNQAPGNTGGLLLPLHPDALLQNQIANGKAPDRYTAIQPERFDMYESLGLNRTTAPAIGEQRPATLVVMQGGVGLGKNQATAERRMCGSDQETVITTCQTLRNRAASIPAEAICKPPFAPAGLVKIAADGTAEVNEFGRLHFRYF